MPRCFRARTSTSFLTVAFDQLSMVKFQVVSSNKRGNFRMSSILQPREALAENSLPVPKPLFGRPRALCAEEVQRV